MYVIWYNPTDLFMYVYKVQIIGLNKRLLYCTLFYKNAPLNIWLIVLIKKNFLVRLKHFE